MDSQNGVKVKDETEERDDNQYYSELHESAIVDCDTTAGPFAIELYKEWSPIGYDRAVELFERGFYDNSHFFRVVPNFLVQFGMSYTDDQELKKFAGQTIKDDPQLTPPIAFDEGIVSFAGSGKDSRTSHLFVAYRRASSLGTQLWETPIGVVIQGMENLEKLNHEYGDMPPWGNGPEQHKIHSLGKAYIEDNFPHLDKFLTCRVIRSIEGYGDDGHDDIVEIDVKELKEEIDKKLLQKSATSSQIKDNTSRGFEIPLFCVIAVILLIIIGKAHNKKTKRSTGKSQ